MGTLRSGVLLFAAVLVVGCQSAVDSSVPAASAPPPSRAGSSQSTPDASWSPPPPSLKANPTYRRDLGPYAGYVLGDTALVPWGSPEHLQFMLTCLQSAGFNVTIDDRGISAAPGPDQVSFYRDALKACEQEGVDSGLVMERKPYGPKEWSVIYDALHITSQCLIEHGYPTPGPPSKDAYIESGGRWHPYDLLAPAAIDEAEQVCPQDLVILFQMMAQGTKP